MTIWRTPRGRIALLALSFALPALADTQFRVRKMTRDDVPLGKGQCDIRLQVDGEVEVSVRRDTVFIRTISGQEARDDGSECNEPLPERPPEGFGFQVADSRNEIRLLSEPSGRTNGAAVVRIRDSAGGYGRYHFRLSWAMTGRGPFPDRRDPVPQPRRNDDFRGGPPDRGFARNNAIHYSGPGRGEARMGGRFGSERLSDVSVDIDRGGRIQVSFRTEGRRSMAFNGSVMSEDRGTIKADVSTEDGRLRGSLFLSVDNRREIYRVTGEMGNGRDRLRLDWDRR